jgi:hypothetical protein
MIRQQFWRGNAERAFILIDAPYTVENLIDHTPLPGGKVQGNQHLSQLDGPVPRNTD